ncbi:MAG: hypothetical protein ACLFWD_11315 [Anaerolineales bacterium]
MDKRYLFAIFALLAAALAGCATAQTTPTESATEPAETEAAATSTPSEPMETTPTPLDYGEEGVLPPEANDLIEATRADLAARLEIQVDDIEVAYVEAMNWPDAALGCPALDVNYATVVTPGYQIELRVDDEIYEYHTDATSNFVLCQQGEPLLPVLPMETPATAES